MKTTFVAILGLAVSSLVFADMGEHGMDKMNPMGAMKGGGGMGNAPRSGMQMRAAAAELSNGEVQAVEREAGRVTIKHAPVPSMDLPAMSMVYAVESAELLEHVKPGDKVRFAAQNRNGTLTVTQLEPAH